MATARGERSISVSRGCRGSRPLPRLLAVQRALAPQLVRSRLPEAPPSGGCGAPTEIRFENRPSSVAHEVGEAALLVHSVISSPRSRRFRSPSRELVSREEVATITGAGPTVVERVRVDGTSSARRRTMTAGESVQQPGAVPFADCDHGVWTGGPHGTKRSARGRRQDARGRPGRADRHCTAGRSGRRCLAFSASPGRGCAVALSPAPTGPEGGSIDRRPHSLTRGLLPPCHIPKERST
jgi:hypothetical protein